MGHSMPEDASSVYMVQFSDDGAMIICKCNSDDWEENLVRGS